MKKHVVTGLLSVFLLFGVLLSLLPSKAILAQETTWYRDEYICPDEIHHKVRCTIGGAEQCEAKYCTPELP
jgi:hypothetical protein